MKFLWLFLAWLAVALFVGADICSPLYWPYGCQGWWR